MATATATANGVAKAVDVAKAAAPVFDKAAKVVIGAGVTKLGLDKAQEAYKKNNLESKAVNETKETEDRHASDSAFAPHAPYDTIPNGSPITDAGPSFLAPDTAEKIRSTISHGSQSAHSLYSATATKPQTWAPNVKVTGQGVRIEFPASAWPLALAAVGIYAVGSWLFSSSEPTTSESITSESTSGTETTTGDTSATLLRQKSHSSAPGSHVAAASGSNAAGGDGGDGGGGSSDEGEGERGKKKRTKDQLLPYRDTRLSKSMMDDLLKGNKKQGEKKAEAIYKKLMEELEGTKEGRRVWHNEYFRIDAGRTFKGKPNIKSWKLQVNKEARRNKRYEGLRDGRGTHATLFEGKIDLNAKPSLDAWKREIMETFK